MGAGSPLGTLGICGGSPAHLHPRQGMGELCFLPCGHSTLARRASCRPDAPGPGRFPTGAEGLGPSRFPVSPALLSAAPDPSPSLCCPGPKRSQRRYWRKTGACMPTAQAEPQPCSASQPVGSLVAIRQVHVVSCCGRQWQLGPMYSSQPGAAAMGEVGPSHPGNDAESPPQVCGGHAR